MKKKYDLVVLTDFYPGFFSLEEGYLIDKNISCLVLSEVIDDSNTNLFESVKLNQGKKSIPIFLKSICYLLIHLEYKNLLNSKEKNKWLKIKTSFNWMRKALLHVKLIESKCIISEDTRIYSYWGDEKAVCASLLVKKYGLTSVVRFHRWDLYNEIHKIYKLPFRDLISNNIKSLVFISEQGKNYFLKDFPFLKNKTFVSYLGTPSPLQKNASGINPLNQTMTLLSCSYLVPVKRIDVLFDTIKEMQQEGFQIVWHHIGGGKELENFQNLISTEGISNIFFHGDKTNEEVHEFIATKQIDLFINVSASEGLPVTIMEALSYSIPCIAPNVGGISEAIISNYNGFILKPSPEVNEIKLAIKKFNSLTASEREKLAENARKTWLEKFDNFHNTKHFFQSFLEL